MLFQSPAFLFLFLPVVLAGFAVLRRTGTRRGVVAWLIAASLFFYAQWEPVFVLLIVGSTCANYGLGRWLGAAATRRRRVLALGLFFNLAILGYFKYRGFFAETLNALAGTHYDLGAIVLPLGISFFSFQKIAYLVDVYPGTPPERNFGNYLLFVLFFPQLIAGPIVHPAEVLPQMRTASTWRGPADWEAVRRGLVYFVLGLAKKVILADGISPFIGTTFDWANRAGGAAVGGAEAWSAALGYTLQLYFDFSGYTDMAIGLALLFNIRLPLNFDAPYRSRSIQEFWQRWHMTLSRFIRDYVYIPLGGNRHGTFNHLRNLLLTMLIAGLWHGAGWHFVVWGGVHGLYLVIHDLWRRARGGSERQPFWAPPLTFLAVGAAWVLFRADTLAAAGRLYAAMAGVHGWGRLPHGNLLGWLIAGTAIVFLAPTTQQWAEMAGTAPGSRPWARLLPLACRPWAALALAVLAFACLRTILAEPPSEFIYFNF